MKAFLVQEILEGNNYRDVSVKGRQTYHTNSAQER